MAPFLLLLLLACNQAASPPSPVQFTEVTVPAGLDFVHYNGAQGEY